MPTFRLQLPRDFYHGILELKQMILYVATVSSSSQKYEEVCADAILAEYWKPWTGACASLCRLHNAI